MTTTADEKIMNAKDLLSQAYRELLIVLDENTWGHSDFNEEYIDKINDIAM